MFLELLSACRAPGNYGALFINPFWVPTQDNYKEWLENFSADFDLCWLIGCNYGSSGHGTRRCVAQLRQQTWRRGFLRIISPSRGLSIGVPLLGVRGLHPTTNAYKYSIVFHEKRGKIENLWFQMKVCGLFIVYENLSGHQTPTHPAIYVL